MFTFLSNEEIAKIHNDTLNVLNTVGLIFESKEAVEILLQKGAKINHNRILLPKELVEELLSNIKDDNFILEAGAKENTLDLSNVSSTLNTNRGFSHFSQDLDKGHTRRIEEGDILDICHLVNKMDELQILSLPLLFGENGEVKALELALQHSNKHIFAPCTSKKSAIGICNLLKNTSGANYFSAFISNSDPLVFKKETSKAQIELVKKGIPIGVRYQIPIAYGDIGLYKLLLLGNIQNIGSLILTKAVEPKTLHFYCGYEMITNIPLGLYHNESFDLALLGSAQGQLADFYGLPSILFTDQILGRSFDTVHGFEKNVIYHSFMQMTKGRILSWLGSIDFGTAYSLDNIILDREVLEMAKAYGRNFSASDEKLALDIIDEVGPSGHFLSHRHTIRHFYEELWLKNIEDSFIFNGANQDYIEKAKNKVKEMIG